MTSLLTQYECALQEVDTALLLLYAELAPSKLLALASTSCDVHVDDVDSTLRRHQRHHALALVHLQQRDVSTALETWQQIVDGQLQDSTFPGLQHVIDVITRFVHVLHLIHGHKNHWCTC